MCQLSLDSILVAVNTALPIDVRSATTNKGSFAVNLDSEGLGRASVAGGAGIGGESLPLSTDDLEDFLPLDLSGLLKSSQK